MDSAKHGWARRDPPAGPGDLWSGGGRAYQDWMRPPPRQRPPAEPGPPDTGLTEVGRAEGGRRRRPRILLACLAMLPPLAFLAAPLAWAVTPRPCEAFEATLTRDVSRRVADTWDAHGWPFPVAAPDGSPLSQGRIGARIASQEYPGWPRTLACTLLFWRVRAGTIGPP